MSAWNIHAARLNRESKLPGSIQPRPESSSPFRTMMRWKSEKPTARQKASPGSFVSATSSSILPMPRSSNHSMMR